MNNINRDQELLDLITQDNLDQHTNAKIIERCADPTFDIERKKAIALREVIIASTHKSLKEELQLMDQELVSQKQKRNNLLYVISAIILLTVGFLLYTAFSKNKKVLPSDLYAMYYTPHPNSIDPLTKGTKEISLSATQEYELGNYKTAVKMLTASTRSETSQWYLAQAHMADLNWTEASLYLHSIVEQNGKYSNSAKWFIALIYVHKGKISEAQKLLEEVAANSDNGYALKAKNLLAEL